MKPPLALQIWCGIAATVLNAVALAGWSGGAYCVAVLIGYLLGHTVTYPPVLPFIVGAAVLMATLDGFWRGRDVVASEMEYRAARANTEARARS